MFYVRLAIPAPRTTGCTQALSMEQKDLRFELICFYHILSVSAHIVLGSALAFTKSVFFCGVALLNTYRALF